MWFPTGSGSSLSDSGRAITATALALGGLGALITAWLSRHRLRALSCAVVAGLTLSTLGFFICPRASEARLIVLDPATGRAMWSVSGHNVTVFDGILGATPSTLIVEGYQIGAHTCDGTAVMLTIDRVRHRVVAIHRSPQYVSSPPPVPKPLDPRRYRAIPGHRVRICHS